VTDPSPPVYKFGGTSLADASRIAEAARLATRADGVPVVVVSALAGTTTELERLAGLPDDESRGAGMAALEARHRDAARALLAAFPDGDAERRALDERLDEVLSEIGAALVSGGEGSGRRDALVAAGEDLSVALVTTALRARGARARMVDARDIVRTDSRFGRAAPEDITTVRLARERLAPLLTSGEIPVVQGFIGADARGRTTTLGRGGSDFTAAIVGAALGAREVTIWTDVDGIFSADPAHVPGARILPELGYEEAVELAYFGARVIHPAAAKHAVARRVTLRIRNTFRPDAPGTLIHSDRRETPGVAAIAYKPGTVLIRVRSRPMFMAYGFLSRVFEVLARHRVPVDLVATSHTSTAFTVDRAEELDTVKRSLEEVAEVEVLDGLGTLSLVGRGLLEVPGIAGEIFRVIGTTPIQLISQATDTSLSLLVGEGDAPALVRRLHEALIEAGAGGATRGTGA
jgi:aspartate kinase